MILFNLIRKEILPILIVAGIILGIYLKINGMIKTIASQKSEIAMLSAKIELQNLSVITLEKETNILTTSLKDVELKNKKLNTQISALKTEIDNRPTASSCDESILNLSNTASKIASDWNNK